MELFCVRADGVPRFLDVGAAVEFCLVGFECGVDLSAFMASWIERVKLPNAVRVQIDIDPYSFL